MNAPAPTVSVAGLCAALVAAQAAARAVAKDATNSFHRYKYASAEAIIAEAREALSGAGLALLTVGWSMAAAQSGADGFPGGVIGRVEVRYRLVHASGEVLDLDASTPVIPEKGRPADKAEAAALTANLAYMLRGLLLLPRDDDQAAIDARDDRGYQPGQQRPAAPAATGSAPAAAPAPAPQRAPAPAAAPAAAGERGAWEALANEIKRKVLACESVDQLKADIVQTVKKAQADGMPAELVRDVQTFYAERKQALATGAA